MKQQLSKIWVSQLRYKWSLIRHAKSPKKLTTLQEQKYKRYIPRSLTQVQQLAIELYKRFKYTNDNWDRLYDSIDTPASCWIKAIENPPLQDDCDGFHAAIYCMTNYCFACRLLTVVTENIHSSHTLLLIKHHNQYYYLDYRKLSNNFKDVNVVIQNIKQYRYKNSNSIIYFEISKWDGNQWRSDNSF